MPYFIKSKQPTGRYRGGKQHTAKGQVWGRDVFTSAQLAAIQADPMLVVRECTAAEAKKLAGEAGQETIDAAQNPAEATPQTSAAPKAAPKKSGKVAARKKGKAASKTRAKAAPAQSSPAAVPTQEAEA